MAEQRTDLPAAGAEVRRADDPVEHAFEQAVEGVFRLPWLPEGRLIQVQDRGEFFVRVHEHADPDVPVLLLLHGWTASADLQWFTAYRALSERCSFVAIDHRGHGRGLRTVERFTLEDAADDAAIVARELGFDGVVAVGYSMGGPIAMHLARRHPDLVRGLALQATALEWRATVFDRLSWMWLPFLGAALRSWAFPRYLKRTIARVIPVGHELEPYLPWILGELQRGSAHAIVEAGGALKRHDARPWAPTLDVPAAVLVTTKDRLVRPRKQRALAAALGARITEFSADHFCTMAQPTAYTAAAVASLDPLLGELAGDAEPTL